MESDETSAADRQVDFFISHAGQDQVWAEWLAWQLIEAGYTVELAVWDWTPGHDFVARMHTIRPAMWACRTNPARSSAPPNGDRK